MAEPKLKYSFTKDKKLLKQYYRLRKVIYHVDLGIELDEYNDEYDNLSEILVVKRKQRCVGGARITVSKPGSHLMLPMENEDFILRRILNEYNLKNYGYAEFSRLVLAPQYRDTKISEKVYKQLNRKARQMGARYIFVITDYLHARRYLRSYRKLGYDVKILHDVILPESVMDKYDHVVQCVIMLDLQPEPKYKPEAMVHQQNVVELVV